MNKVQGMARKTLYSMQKLQHKSETPFYLCKHCSVLGTISKEVELNMHKHIEIWHTLSGRFGWGPSAKPDSNTQRKKEDAFYSLQIFLHFFFFKQPEQPNNSINNNKTKMCHTVENVITAWITRGPWPGWECGCRGQEERFSYYRIFKLCNSMHIY